MNDIEKFLFELRESADCIYNVFTKGSCFRLYRIIKSFNKNALPYWSDIDSHCIIKVDDIFYDIGGQVNARYAEEKGYYLVPEQLIDGYSLLKYTKSEDDKSSITIERYRK